MPGPAPRLLIGTFVTGHGDSARREAAGQASLAKVGDGATAACVNVAFTDGPSPSDALPAIPALRLDAPSLSGVAGIRKPIVSEVIDVLCAEADRRGCPRVALVNGDIVVTPLAVKKCAESEPPAIAIARTDFGGGEPETQLLYGVDMLAFDVAFWRRERRRFRAYPLGEGVWDNVYTAVAVAHGGVLFNRERLILHERHARSWQQSPFASYVHQLASRDGSYFSLWCRYVAAVESLRARAGSEAEELALQRRIFRPPGAFAEAVDVARAAWWRARRRWRRDSVS
jgi:hypothetical protein